MICVHRRLKTKGSDAQSGQAEAYKKHSSSIMMEVSDSEPTKKAKAQDLAIVTGLTKVAFGRHPTRRTKQSRREQRLHQLTTYMVEHVLQDVAFRLPSQRMKLIHQTAWSPNIHFQHVSSCSVSVCLRVCLMVFVALVFLALQPMTKVAIYRSPMHTGRPG